jgi:5-(carboxyamino)imidazole ribonucleotide synthase
MVFYPLVENEHRGGILSQTIAPAPDVSGELEALARRKLRLLLEELDYAGAIAIEFFEVAGRLFAGEFAPRVHNSGHWTLDAAATSQFENHLRAILGWPLGAAHTTRPAIMLNLISQAPPPAELLRSPSARLHLYGKAPRPGRKLGHVTFVGEDAAEQAAALRARLNPGQ